MAEENPITKEVTRNRTTVDGSVVRLTTPDGESAGIDVRNFSDRLKGEFLIEAVKAEFGKIARQDGIEGLREAVQLMNNDQYTTARITMMAETVARMYDVSPLEAAAAVAQLSEADTDKLKKSHSFKIVYKELSLERERKRAAKSDEGDELPQLF